MVTPVLFQTPVKVVFYSAVMMCGGRFHVLMGDSRSQTSKTCSFVVMFKWFEYRIYHKYWDLSSPANLFLSLLMLHSL